MEASTRDHGRGSPIGHRYDSAGRREHPGLEFECTKSELKGSSGKSLSRIAIAPHSDSTSANRASAKSGFI